MPQPEVRFGQPSAAVAPAPSADRLQPEVLPPQDAGYAKISESAGQRASRSALVDLIERLTRTGSERFSVELVGLPGAGKTALLQALAAELATKGVVVAPDGISCQEMLDKAPHARGVVASALKASSA